MASVTHRAVSAARTAVTEGAAFTLITNQLKHNGTDNQEKKEGNEYGSNIGCKP